MNIRTFVRALVALMVLSSQNIVAAESRSDLLNGLEPIIGAYPPNINGEDELASVKSRYEKLKVELDSAIEASPKDEKLLFERAHLQSMGHNFDYPGAWQGSTDDFKAILTIDPAHIGALVGLGSLWVNSDQSLAPKAEGLFRAAQCYTGKEPLEAAQRGLFFALYYQAKLQDAYRQSVFLVKTWPENEDYQRANEATREVLEGSGGGAPVVELVAMASCSE